MKTKKAIRAHVSRLLCLMMAVALLAALAVPAAAAEANDAVTKAKNAVIQVQLWFVDPQHLGSDLYLGYGTGFLINENTIITNEHVVDFKSDTSMAGQYADAMNEVFGLRYTPQDIMEHMQLRVSILRDVYVDVSIRTVSTEMDYAVLTLSEKLHNRATLPLRSSSSLRQTETVYALGFPGDVDDITDQSFYDSEDVTITTGAVNKVARLSFTANQSTAIGNFRRLYENVDCVESSARIAGGNSGGPLVDANGAVVGINTLSTSESVGTERNLAIAIDQLIATLDALGIEYEKYSDVPEPTVAPTVAPTEAPTVAPTEAPIVEPTAAPTEAPTVAPTEPPVTPEPNPTPVILIVAAVAVLAVIIVVVVVLSKGKKKTPAPVSGSYTPPAPTANTASSKGGFSTPSYTAPMGAGETTVLSQDAGETTVLTRNVNGGTLTRKRTGETVTINAENFVIGRERKTANYCIADNSSISRSHVTLTVRNGVTYLTDMNAANGTFVNGVKIAPRQEVALKNGDKITLSDEEFEYKI